MNFRQHYGGAPHFRQGYGFGAQHAEFRMERLETVMVAEADDLSMCEGSPRQFSPLAGNVMSGAGA